MNDLLVSRHGDTSHDEVKKRGDMKRTHVWEKIDSASYRKNRSAYLTLEEAAMLYEDIPKYRCSECGIVRYVTRNEYLDNECSVYSMKKVINA